MIRALLGAGALLLQTPTHAQTTAAASALPSDGPDVTLKQLLAHADRHAPQLRVTQTRWRAVDAERDTAAALLGEDPELQLTAGPRYAHGGGRDYDVILTLSQPIEVAGQRSSRLTVAAAKGRRWSAGLEAERSELRRQISVTYADAALARTKLEIQQQLQELALDQLQQARQRQAAGDVGAVDVTLAELDAARAAEERVQAEQEYRSLRLELCELSGWPLAQPPRPVAALPAGAIRDRVSEASRDAGEHPDVLAANAAVQEAAAQVELARREAVPDLALGVTAAREGAPAGGPAQYLLLGTLAVELPLWQPSGRAQAEAERDIARAERDATAHAVRARLARARQAVRSAAARVLLVEGAPIGAARRDLVRRAYAAGELDPEAYASAMTRLLEAELAQAEAVAAYRRALAELEALGGLVPTRAGRP